MIESQSRAHVIRKCLFQRNEQLSHLKHFSSMRFYLMGLHALGNAF